MKRLLMTSLLLAAAPVAAPVTYDHDDAGRLVRAAYDSFEIRYRYDESGNLLRRTVNADTDIIYADGFEGG